MRFHERMNKKMKKFIREYIECRHCHTLCGEGGSYKKTTYTRAHHQPVHTCSFHFIFSLTPPPPTSEMLQFQPLFDDDNDSLSSVTAMAIESQSSDCDAFSRDSFYSDQPQPQLEITEPSSSPYSPNDPLLLAVFSDQIPRNQLLNRIESRDSETCPLEATYDSTECLRPSILCPYDGRPTHNVSIHFKGYHSPIEENCMEPCDIDFCAHCDRSIPFEWFLREYLPNSLPHMYLNRVDDTYICLDCFFSPYYSLTYGDLEEFDEKFACVVANDAHKSELSSTRSDVQFSLPCLGVRGTARLSLGLTAPPFIVEPIASKLTIMSIDKDVTIEDFERFLHLLVLFADRGPQKLLEIEQSVYFKSDEFSASISSFGFSLREFTFLKSYFNNNKNPNCVAQHDTVHINACCVTQHDTIHINACRVPCRRKEEEEECTATAAAATVEERDPIIKHNKP